MEPKVNYTVVGAFVILLGAAALAGVIWLSKSDISRSYDRYYCYMRESVSGLSANGTVKYRGVEVGRVEEIILNPDNSEEVRLTLGIKRGTPVKEDTVAVLDVQGLTGLAVINLAGGTQDSPPLAIKPGERYPVIKAGRSLFARIDTELSRVLSDQSIARILGNTDGLTADARKVVDEENRTALKRTLHDASIISHDLATHSQLMDQSVVTTAQTINETHLLVMELRQLTATFQRIANKVERHPSVLLRDSSRQDKGPGE